jgi:hypothetical protein
MNTIRRVTYSHHITRSHLLISLPNTDIQNSPASAQWHSSSSERRQQLNRALQAAAYLKKRTELCPNPAVRHADRPECAGVSLSLHLCKRLCAAVVLVFTLFVLLLGFTEEECWIGRFLRTIQDITGRF